MNEKKFKLKIERLVCLSVCYVTACELSEDAKKLGHEGLLDLLPLLYAVCIMKELLGSEIDERMLRELEKKLEKKLKKNKRFNKKFKKERKKDGK